jgi:hypothetical protein
MKTSGRPGAPHGPRRPVQRAASGPGQVRAGWSGGSDQLPGLSRDIVRQRHSALASAWIRVPR